MGNDSQSRRGDLQSSVQAMDPCIHGAPVETFFRVSPLALHDTNTTIGRTSSDSIVCTTAKDVYSLSNSACVASSELSAITSDYEPMCSSAELYMARPLLEAIAAFSRPSTPCLAGKQTPHAPAMMMDFNPLFEEGQQQQRHSRKTDRILNADVSTNDQDLHKLLYPTPNHIRNFNPGVHNLPDSRRSDALDQYLDDSDPMLLQLRQLEANAEIGTALHGQVMTLRQRLASAQKQLTQRESQMDGLARSMSATRRRLAPGEGQESSIQEGEMERQLAILVQRMAAAEVSLACERKAKIALRMQLTGAENVVRKLRDGRSALSGQTQHPSSQPAAHTHLQAGKEPAPHHALPSPVPSLTLLNMQQQHKQGAPDAQHRLAAKTNSNHPHESVYRRLLRSPEGTPPFASYHQKNITTRMAQPQQQQQERAHKQEQLQLQLQLLQQQSTTQPKTRHTGLYPQQPLLVPDFNSLPVEPWAVLSNQVFSPGGPTHMHRRAEVSSAREPANHQVLHTPGGMSPKELPGDPATHPASATLRSYGDVAPHPWHHTRAGVQLSQQGESHTPMVTVAQSADAQAAALLRIAAAQSHTDATSPELSAEMVDFDPGEAFLEDGSLASRLRHLLMLSESAEATTPLAPRRSRSDPPSLASRQASQRPSRSSRDIVRQGEGMRVNTSGSLTSPFSVDSNHGGRSSYAHQTSSTTLGSPELAIDSPELDGEREKTELTFIPLRQIHGSMQATSLSSMLLRPPFSPAALISAEHMLHTFRNTVAAAAAEPPVPIHPATLLQRVLFETNTATTETVFGSDGSGLSTHVEPQLQLERQRRPGSANNETTIAPPSAPYLSTAEAVAAALKSPPEGNRPIQTLAGSEQGHEQITASQRDESDFLSWLAQGRPSTRVNKARMLLPASTNAPTSTPTPLQELITWLEATTSHPHPSPSTPAPPSCRNALAQSRPHHANAAQTLSHGEDMDRILRSTPGKRRLDPAVASPAWNQVSPLKQQRSSSRMSPASMGHIGILGTNNSRRPSPTSLTINKLQQPNHINHHHQSQRSSTQPGRGTTILPTHTQYPPPPSNHSQFSTPPRHGSSQASHPHHRHPTSTTSSSRQTSKPQSTYAQLAVRSTSSFVRSPSRRKQIWLPPAEQAEDPRDVLDAIEEWTKHAYLAAKGLLLEDAPHPSPAPSSAENVPFPLPVMDSKSALPLPSPMMAVTVNLPQPSPPRSLLPPHPAPDMWHHNVYFSREVQQLNLYRGSLSSSGSDGRCSSSGRSDSSTYYAGGAPLLPPDASADRAVIASAVHSHVGNVSTAGLDQHGATAGSSSDKRGPSMGPSQCIPVPGTRVTACELVPGNDVIAGEAGSAEVVEELSEDSVVPLQLSPLLELARAGSRAGSSGDTTTSSQDPSQADSARDQGFHPVSGTVCNVASTAPDQQSQQKQQQEQRSSTPSPTPSPSSSVSKPPLPNSRVKPNQSQTLSSTQKNRRPTTSTHPTYNSFIPTCPSPAQATPTTNSKPTRPRRQSPATSSDTTSGKDKLVSSPPLHAPSDSPSTATPDAATRAAVQAMPQRSTTVTSTARRPRPVFALSPSLMAVPAGPRPRAPPVVRTRAFHATKGKVASAIASLLSAGMALPAESASLHGRELGKSNSHPSANTPGGAAGAPTRKAVVPVLPGTGIRANDGASPHLQHSLSQLLHGPPSPSGTPPQQPAQRPSSILASLIHDALFPSFTSEGSSAPSKPSSSQTSIATPNVSRTNALSPWSGQTSIPPSPAPLYTPPHHQDANAMTVGDFYLRRAQTDTAQQGQSLFSSDTSSTLSSQFNHVSGDSYPSHQAHQDPFATWLGNYGAGATTAACDGGSATQAMAWALRPTTSSGGRSSNDSGSGGWGDSDMTANSSPMPFTNTTPAAAAAAAGPSNNSTVVPDTNAAYVSDALLSPDRGVTRLGEGGGVHDTSVQMHGSGSAVSLLNGIFSSTAPAYSPPSSGNWSGMLPPPRQATDSLRSDSPEAPVLSFSLSGTSPCRSHFRLARTSANLASSTQSPATVVASSNLTLQILGPQTTHLLPLQPSPPMVPHPDVARRPMPPYSPRGGSGSDASSAESIHHQHQQLHQEDPCVSQAQLGMRSADGASDKTAAALRAAAVSLLSSSLGHTQQSLLQPLLSLGLFAPPQVEDDESSPLNFPTSAHADGANTATHASKLGASEACSITPLHHGTSGSSRPAFGGSSSAPRHILPPPAVMLPGDGGVGGMVTPKKGGGGSGMVFGGRGHQASPNAPGGLVCGFGAGRRVRKRSSPVKRREREVPVSGTPKEGFWRNLLQGL